MRLRAPVREDADAVFAVLAARDSADLGHPDVTLEDVLLDWATPGIDPALDCVVAEDADGAIVGYGLVDHRGAMVAVHPGAEGRGVGTALRERMEARTRERGLPLTQFIAAANAAGAAHLRAAGYELAHEYQRMTAPLGTVPPLPRGAPVRTFDLDAEGPAVHALIGDAFGDIDGDVSDPFDTWRCYVSAKSEPPFRLVVEQDGAIAGAVVGEPWPEGTGYVSELAVDRRARGRGHGRTLLLAIFDAFVRAGLTRTELSVHGRNLGALSLYESVGLTPAFRQQRWSKPSAGSPVQVHIRTVLGH